MAKCSTIMNISTSPINQFSSLKLHFTCVTCKIIFFLATQNPRFSTESFRDSIKVNVFYVYKKNSVRTSLFYKKSDKRSFFLNMFSLQFMSQLQDHSDNFILQMDDISPPQSGVVRNHLEQNLPHQQIRLSAEQNVPLT